jgi:hypothetical protein
MPVTPNDRPIETLREETVDQLIMNYGHGKLSREAFERRLDEALDTKSHDKLLELTRDLDLQVDRQFAQQKKAELGIRVEPVPAGGTEEPEYMVNVFGGTTRKGTWHVPRMIRIVNVFGATDLDFTNATFSAQTTYITTFCLFGGIDVRVREGLRTVSRAVCIFGGVDNRGPSTSDANAPVIVVEGFVLFGGIDIKLKKTPKQHLQEFANQLRTMFNADPPRA